MRSVESKSTFVIIMAHTTPHTGMLLRKIAKLYTLLDAIMSRKRKAKAKGKGQAKKRSASVFMMSFRLFKARVKLPDYNSFAWLLNKIERGKVH